MSTIPNQINKFKILFLLQNLPKEILGLPFSQMVKIKYFINEIEHEWKNIFNYIVMPCDLISTPLIFVLNILKLDQQNPEHGHKRQNVPQQQSLQSTQQLQKS
ncbi:hypothetical protein BpHYR1_016695 [Brachionus plicatilis]|uniref:Uncharacterized protein n=1 Tax=Brachionus plicatilis TaxID=10195 RepID=A0A3M7RGX3_BRAPC|nr:hypothetical protein BpHYR1_016695 [Brachionus plicatilis]